MKTLYLSIVVIISVIALGASTVPSSYTTEFNATMDKMYYNGTDTAHVIISGPPSTHVNLAVIDSSYQQKLATVVHLDPNGTGKFSFNVTSFNDGIYYAMIGQGYDSIKIGFGVGLMPSGPIIAVNVMKDTYVPGDSITIHGAEGPNGIIQLSLIDPNGNVVKSVQTNSDDAGLFSSYDLKIPTNAISGIWKIMATHGITHSSIDIKVNSMSNGAGKNNTNATNGVGGSIVTIHIDSPLKQIDNGTPTENIICSNYLELIYKASNKYPVCVQHPTAEKLIQRGWGIWQPVNYFVKTDGFLIPYDLIGGNMLGVKSVQNQSMIFSVHTTSSGVLYVTIPRTLLDSKSAYSNQDTQFIILVDKQEVKYTETTSITARTLTIPLDLGAKEIEIDATIGI
jgi:hypothetical protein